MTALRGNHGIFYLVLALMLGIAGCAEINPFEAPEEVIKHPLGTESIKVGMSRDKVIKEWGNPDIINKLGAQDATGTEQEEWIYKARQYAGIPVDAGYLSKNKYLYFDGNNLVSISDEPRQKQ